MIGLEDRKRKEIEHSKKRREILKGYERLTETADFKEQLHHLIKTDKKEFEKHFSNMKFYSITRLSEDYKNNFIKSTAGENIQYLDFACGNGENGLIAAQNGANVIGIDISPEGIDNANDNASKLNLTDKCKFTVMDGENMSFGSNTFDFAVEYGALHHVDLPVALKELARVLKPNAEMICVEALRHNPFIHLYRKFTPHLRTEWEVEHILGVESLKIMEKYFQNIEVRFFHLFSLFAVPFRKFKFIFKFLLYFLEKVDLIILKIPYLRRFAWIMVITLKNPIK